VKPEPKPDIALKEKLEKEKKLKEQKELELKKKEEEKRKLAQELERKKEEEKRKQKELEVRKLEEEKKRLEKERLAKEAEEKRLQQERQAIADRLAKEQAAQRSLIDKYTRLIENHVKRQIIEPPNLQGNPQVEFDVVLIPGGEVLSIRLRRSSGNAAYDAAVERAIVKASPLPLPPDSALFQQFRDLHLRIRPKE
jgi:colicin import membrane protein